jgi:hypothetical protein
MTTHSSTSFWQRPGTRLGWWSVGLAIAFAAMSIINSAVFMRASEPAWWRQYLLPFYGIFMMLCGLSAGVVGLFALIRMHERSWLVWLTIIQGAFVLIFILGEFLVPH